MSSFRCHRCKQVADSVTPDGLCATCHAADAATELTSPNSVTAEVVSGETRAAPGEPDLSNALPEGGYELHEELGEGGMGKVFRAVQVSTGKTVAVKKLQPNSYTLSGLRRFVIEARALGAVDHPNVVRVIDFVPDPADPLLVMEYVPGKSLSKLLKENGPLPPDRAAKLIADAARGVAAAHAVRVIHRDLKPGNLLVTPDDHVKVADFGLGKRLAEADVLTLLAGGSEFESADGVTQTGKLAGGTPGYMAPEQVDPAAGVCGPAADVWGLGACLYTALVGKPPYPGGEKNMRRVLTDPLISPRQANPAVPPVLDAIVCKCLAKDPAKRYESAAEVAADLDRFRAGDSTLALPHSRADRMWRRMRRWPRAAVIAWAVAATVVIGGGIGLAMIPKGMKQPPLRTPDDELADMQKRFNDGEEVVIVGEKGLPKWGKWIAGKAEVTDAPTGDGTAFIRPFSECALVLFTPPSDSYRVNFELRHTEAKDINDTDNSRVGVFLYQQQQSGNGFTVDSYQTITYHDCEGRPTGIPTPSQKLSVENRLYYECEEQRHTAKNIQEFADSMITFPVQIIMPGAWRKLTAEVCPTGVRIFWASDCEAALQEIAYYPVDLLNQRYAHHRNTISRLPPAIGLDPNPIPMAWNPSGGLGVWASQSGLSFRNVSVRPISRTQE